MRISDWSSDVCSSDLEASWGQHYAGWLTPENWQALNDQGETNLHNTSSWLDQKPRTLLEIGVIVGGILIPMLALRRPALREGRFAIFLDRKSTRLNSSN